MKIKHLLLPIMVGMGSFMLNANAQTPDGNMQSTTKSALSFIENKGQVTDQFLEHREDIDFKMAAGNGLNIFFGKGKIEYQWSERIKSEAEIAREANGLLQFDLEEESNEMETSIVEMYRMDVELINPNPNPTIIAEGKKSFFERYFLSWVNKDNSNEGVKVRAYEKIIYKDIYPNIDWVFYITPNQQVEHDFIVHPGGKVSDIQIKYSGSIDLNIEEDGSLFAKTPKGSIKENTPYSFDQNGQEIASKFILNHNILSFEVAAYSGKLTIDPILEWGTYFGGSDDDKSFDLAMDKFGDIYMAGGTNSSSNIATTGAHETTFQGGTSSSGGDAFLSKWSSDGDLLWATFYGGDNIDVAKGIACDTSGNVYLGGYTESEIGISTLNSYQEDLNGWRYDAFIVKFDSSGVREWGTYYGGSGHEASTSFALTTDEFDHIYITGNTQSTDLPTTIGSHQDSRAGGHDIFLAKFDVDGDLVWSTYYGGTSIDHATAITTDTIGDVFITGYTQSITGIATTGTHQEIHAGGYDAFLTKFDYSGNLIWGTYFGGEGLERAYSVKTYQDKIVIGGITTSSIGISAANSFQIVYGGQDDAFVATFYDQGILNWATYYGGNEGEAIIGISLSSNGEYYFLGETSSNSNISTVNSLQSSLNGIRNLFILKMDELGDRIWSTYLGGNNMERGSKMLIDENYNLFITGSTISASNISSLNSYQTNLNGGEDAILIKLNDCPKPELENKIDGKIEVCANAISTYEIDEVDLAEEYVWILPNGWLGDSDSNSIELIVGDDDGILQVFAMSSCGGISDTLSLTITVLPVPKPVIVNNNNILSTSQAYDSYQWMKDKVDITGETNAILVIDENGNYQVKVTKDNECEGISDEEIIDGVGVEDIVNVEWMKVYPNPAQDILLIESEKKLKGSLFTVEGKVIKDWKIETGINQFDLQEVSAGVYYLELFDVDMNKYTMKIVKR